MGRGRLSSRLQHDVRRHVVCDIVHRVRDTIVFKERLCSVIADRVDGGIVLKEDGGFIAIQNVHRFINGVLVWTR